MAAALSRALKLPGKKGSELGEYDPLTQADSDDESEEDDLVCLGTGSSKLPMGGAGLGLHSSDEQKRLRVKNAIRSAFFLVPLVCATVVVLLCAFLIPCQKGDLEKRLQWEKALGGTGGKNINSMKMTLCAFSLCNLFDIYTWCMRFIPVYSAVALSAVSGQVLWKKVMSEAVMYIQCGLQYSTVPSPVCLLICKSYIMAVNGTTGRTSCAEVNKINQLQVFISKHSKIFHFPPQERSCGHHQLRKFDLSLTLISGETGALLGRAVPFNVTAQGTLIGPWLYETQQGVYYILFGLGNVKAVSLRDIYFQATGKLPETQALRKKDLGWEGMKKDNFSSIIQIYRYGFPDFILVACPNLCCCFKKKITFYQNICPSFGKLEKYGFLKYLFVCRSQPVAGHFNSDGILDLFIQHSSNGVMKTLIIDGANGTRLWAAEFVCPHLRLETSAISTSTGQSAFLFWASDPIKEQPSVSPGVAVAEPLIRKLYLLHPTYPTVLLELASTTDTAVTSAVRYQDHQKDASYITVSSSTMPNSVPSTYIVKCVSLRAAITKGQTVWIGDGSKTAGALKPGEVSKFFRHLTFKHQVRKRIAGCGQSDLKCR
uniref:Family with sequence similarity 234 member B n=1 Tax=Neolamprologus brichardi TaxID=32507 RepID=A0A3Q4M4Z1_NEOBR